MQRQSLGTPASKLHNNGGAEEETPKAEEQRRNNKEISSPPSSSSVIKYFDEDDYKPARPRLSLSSDPPPEFNNYIHLIPVVIFISLLCLFIFSHDPSQSDLAVVDGLKPLREKLDSTAITEDIGLYTIKGLRNLKFKSDLMENHHTPEHRRHRKVAVF